MPLLVSDLPAFLRWRGDLPYGAPELEQLVGVADRLIVDSSEWDEPEPGLERLPELFDRIVVSDIAWGRLDPWRRALAGLWPAIAELESLRVDGPEGRGAAPRRLARRAARPGHRARARGRRTRRRRSPSTARTSRPDHPERARRRATSCPSSSRSSAATRSTRRRYGASRESRSSRVRRGLDRRSGRPRRRFASRWPAARRRVPSTSGSPSSTSTGRPGTSGGATSASSRPIIPTRTSAWRARRCSTAWRFPRSRSIRCARSTSRCRSVRPDPARHRARRAHGVALPRRPRARGDRADRVRAGARAAAAASAADVHLSRAERRAEAVAFLVGRGQAGDRRARPGRRRVAAGDAGEGRARRSCSARAVLRDREGLAAAPSRTADRSRSCRAPWSAASCRRRGRGSTRRPRRG